MAIGISDRRIARNELWKKGILSWKLWPQQHVIYQTFRKLPRNVQTVVILCARQFGKSVLIVSLAVEDCLRNPNIIVMIIGPTLKQTKEIVQPRAQLLFGDAPDGLIKHVKSENTWYFANGSELKLGGFETRSAAQRGKTLFKIYIEEICDSEPDDYDDFIRSDLAPALTHSKHAQIIYATTLPKYPDHPFTLDTMPEAVMNGAFFQYTIDDNKKLSKDKYDQCVRLCGGKQSIAFRREYLCEQVRDPSVILAPEYDEDIHIKPVVEPEHAFYWISGDTGIIRDLNVFYLWCYDFRRAKKLVLKEFYCKPYNENEEDYAGIGKMVEAVTKMEGNRTVSRHVDADARLRLDLMKQYKFAISIPEKETLEATVNLVRMELQTCAVEIHPDCKLLRTTLRSGTFNKNKTDLNRTSALGHMDAFMAFAYGLRHANMANPYPAYNGANHFTHYIAPDAKNNASGNSLNRMFTRF